MGEGIVLLLLAVLLVVGPVIVLYVLISEETSKPTVVDREEAEREAKTRGGRARRSQPKGENARKNERGNQSKQHASDGEPRQNER